MSNDVQGDAVVSRPRRFRRWLFGIAIVLVALSVTGGGLLGVAEYRTSQPSFCASCHIMQPYYASWSEDVHGEKLDVACVECHYAPGERTTINAKFRGLSQVTSYFSGRYGATRPRAHVSNESCMTAKCHGDERFMDKPIMLGSVQFTHARHLRRDDLAEKPNGERLAELEKTLLTLVGQEHFAQLESVARESGPAEARYNKLLYLCRQWNSPVERDVLVEFSQLHHRQVRLEQLQDLQCTNCHIYQAHYDAATADSHAQHFQVSTTTCYTCHFNNEGFNTGTNSCLLCHTPPQRQITVHAAVSGAESSDQASDLQTALVKMDHTEIMARKVDCIACHADAAHQDSTVSRRDCERCHDQQRFFDDWKEPFTLDLVTYYHKTHIDRQRAKCLDCHTEIKHQLVHKTVGDNQEGFFTSVLSNCSHCHPNHHVEQVNLLLGRGGTGVPQSEPNLMFGARTNCTGCHVELSEGAHGSQVIKATENSCIACHGDRHKNTFEKWRIGLEMIMGDAEKSFQQARQLLDEKQELPAETRQQANELVDAAEADLTLVKRGNGLHNISYAIELLDSVTSRCEKAIRLLNGN